MVAGRTWSSIKNGLGTHTLDDAETAEIKGYVLQYFKEIAYVLGKVHPEMILIFKTNDLLRAIENALGTRDGMSSVIQMSRACYACVADDDAKRCKSMAGRVTIRARAQWDQFKISLYQVRTKRQGNSSKERIGGT